MGTPYDAVAWEFRSTFSFDDAHLCCNYATASESWAVDLPDV